MPMKSQKQRNAMFAAASGKSNIGIPKKVADEFVASDKGGKLPMRAKKYKHKTSPKGSIGRGFTYRP